MYSVPLIRPKLACLFSTSTQGVFSSQRTPRLNVRLGAACQSSWKKAAPRVDRWPQVPPNVPPTTPVGRPAMKSASAAPEYCPEKEKEPPTRRFVLSRDRKN